MDLTVFETWLGGIGTLTEPQRRMALQALALSEAADSHNIETTAALDQGVSRFDRGAKEPQPAGPFGELQDLALGCLWSLQNALTNEGENTLVDRLFNDIDNLMDHLAALRNRLRDLPNSNLVRIVDAAVLSTDYRRVIVSAQEALVDRNKVSETVHHIEILLNSTRSILNLNR